MTGFVALASTCLAMIVLGFGHIGHFIAVHNTLQQRAELLAVSEARRLHKGENVCLSLPIDVVVCRLEGNQVSLEVQGEISLLGRQFTLKNRASVANQWVDFTDSALP